MDRVPDPSYRETSQDWLILMRFGEQRRVVVKSNLKLLKGKIEA